MVVDPFRAVTLTRRDDDGGERTFQAVPLSIAWDDLGDGTGYWNLDYWDMERDAPDCAPMREITGHEMTMEQAQRLVVRFEWRPEGE